MASSPPQIVPRWTRLIIGPLPRPKAASVANSPGSTNPRIGEAWLRAAFALPETIRVLSALDSRSGRRSFAVMDAGKLIAALYTSPDPVLVSRQWAVGLLTADKLDGSVVLAGRPGADMPDAGAIVCSCFSVGINTIAAAVTGQGCTTVEAVGACTQGQAPIAAPAAPKSGGLSMHIVSPPPSKLRPDRMAPLAVLPVFLALRASA
jgi:hypothetical protein